MPHRNKVSVFFKENCKSKKWENLGEYFNIFSWPKSLKMDMWSEQEAIKKNMDRACLWH